VITDDRDIFETICMDYGIASEQFVTTGSDKEKNDNNLTISYYQDTMLSLSSLYSVKTSLDKALREQIWLKSGASIVLQHTEALTVIDVNSGKNIAKKGMRENLLRINLEAAKEIAYQLRLRNISGIIIIDFINLPAKEDEAILLREFRSYLKDDPVKADLIDMTKLGLVEVTRKKIKKSLRDSLKMNG
jgi:ribonuclease G